MNGRIDAERILDAFLAPEADRLNDRVIDAALADIARTPQRRALRVPWRFPFMPALTRATGIAAVALVAVVGVGGVIYLSSNSGGSGSRSTPAPTTAAVAPTTVASPEASFVAPGITGWKTYTSAVYGYTISYPEDWSVAERATQKWQLGEPEDAPSSDVFFNNAPEGVRDDSMVFVTLQFPGPAGADLSSWDGLLAALTEMCAKPAEFYFSTDHCPSGSVGQASTLMCLGSTGCQPVAFVHHNDLPRALFGDPETGTFTYILVGRLDDFPGAARYGGTVMLLKSILSQLGIREPQPGETPH
jgi:hypothetical protein